MSTPLREREIQGHAWVARSHGSLKVRVFGKSDVAILGEPHRDIDAYKCIGVRPQWVAPNPSPESSISVRRVWSLLHSGEQ